MLDKNVLRNGAYTLSKNGISYEARIIKDKPTAIVWLADGHDPRVAGFPDLEILQIYMELAAPIDQWDARPF